FSSRRRHTRSKRDWSSDVCSSDLSNDPSGGYGSSLGATDDGGLYMTTQLSYVVFASWLLNLQALSLGPNPVPVPGASVTIFVGSAAIYNGARSEEHTSELQSRFDLVCRL